MANHYSEPGMTAALRVGSVGLEGVSPLVYEEVEVVRHHTGGRLEMKLRHSLLPEVKWAGPLLHVGDETIVVQQRN